MNQEDHLFDDLFRKYADRVLHIAYNHVHDYDVAEDICQETFMRFRMHQHKIIEGAERRWLFAVAKNCAIDYLRKGGQYDTKVGIYEELERSLNQNASLQTDLSDAMVVQEKREALKRALNRLAEKKPEWYTVLHLSEVEDMDNSAIGEKMGIRADLVSKWKGRARAWLRNVYLEENGD